MKYDYLIVEAGFFGATFAHEVKAVGKSVLVIDKRPNIVGNVYTEDVEGIKSTAMELISFIQKLKRLGLCESVCCY